VTTTVLRPNEEEKFWGYVAEARQKATEMIGIQGTKSADYNAGGVTILDYLNCGIKPRAMVFYNEIHKKTLRLKSLFAAQQNGAKPNHESMEDNLLDLVNYCLFTYAALRLDELKEAADADRATRNTI
jgi:hypothetical protein